MIILKSDQNTSNPTELISEMNPFLRSILEFWAKKRLSKFEILEIQKSEIVMFVKIKQKSSQSSDPESTMLRLDANISD